jgi:hypothetical protein
MKVRVVSNDYIDFFKLYIKNELAYPIDNPCFNMSFSKFYNKQYLFCVRNVIPFKQIIKKEKLYPGISEYFFKTSKYHTENNISNMFIWDWINYYESNIFFVGEINEKTLKIKPNKNIKPYLLINPYFSYKLPKYLNNKLAPKHHQISMEDFRLFFSNNIAYVYDSNINVIQQMMLIDNKLILRKLYINICNLKNNNVQVLNNNYIKIFEKNWSLYYVKKNMNKKDVEFKFLHDFEENGIYGITFYPIEQRCEKKLLVSYPLKTVPINNKNIRFSLSSPCTKLEDNIFIGIGHIKIKFNITNNNNKNIDQHFTGMATEIHNKMRKIYKKKYKPHRYYVYMNFLFVYNSIKKTFHISNFLLPIPKYDYYFSLSFLTSIQKVGNTFIITGGLGDYCNIMLSINKKDVLKKIKYDISKVNIYDIVYEIVE